MGRARFEFSRGLGHKLVFGRDLRKSGSDSATHGMSARSVFLIVALDMFFSGTFVQWAVFVHWCWKIVD